MKIIVHRGTHEIGGTCIEIIAENGKTLWIDLGLPLNQNNSDIDYVKNRSPDALLISHAHQDHYGLMEYLNKNIPVYLGQVSYDLINATKLFLGNPLLNLTFIPLEAWKRIQIASTFHITSYLVDHSSPEAFAFLIEADGKRIFYSGDFRTTGNKKTLYENLINRPPKNIDLLFLEGTTVERTTLEYPEEEDVKNAICEIVKKQQNITFVISSAQNIDRFVSVVKACIKAKKQVVVDVYNAWVLEVVHKVSPNLPTIDWNEVLVFNHPKQMEKIQSKEFDGFRNRIIQKSVRNELLKNPSRFVYFLRCPSQRLISALKLKIGGKIGVIYSKWEGYLLEEHKTYYTETINNLKNDTDIHFKVIHTSGHATLEKLIELATIIKPKQIVPIHTGNPLKIKKGFSMAGLQNVSIWNDNEYHQI